jgi:prepilin-type N-terminal cleavage/methylation domain-containing protein
MTPRKGKPITLEKGFTLIEFLLYIALFGIIIMFIGGVAVNMLFGSEKMSSIDDVQYSTSFLIKNIRKDISDATAIIAPVQGTTSSELRLSAVDPADNPIIYALDSGHVTRQAGVSEAEVLTPSSVEITNLEFTASQVGVDAGPVVVTLLVRSTSSSLLADYAYEKSYTASISKRK